MVKIPIFWYIMPCRLVNRLQRVEEKAGVAAIRVFQTGYIKRRENFFGQPWATEGASCSKPVVLVYQITWRHVPEDWDFE
jgi:hypothetical protein